MALLVMPSAAGTHSTSRKRSVTPAPQNRLVPTNEKRVSPLRHSVVQALKKLWVIGLKRHDCPGRAAGSFGIHRLATTAPAYTTAQTPSAAMICQSARIPPAIEPSRIAAMVEDSIRPFAFTNLSPVVSSPRMPYLAGE